MTEEAAQDSSLIKQQYLSTFFSKYTDLINYVNSLPVHIQFKRNAVTRLDEGMFWVREGIVHLQTMAPEPTPQEPILEPTLL